MAFASALSWALFIAFCFYIVKGILDDIRFQFLLSVAGFVVSMLVFFTILLH